MAAVHTGLKGSSRKQCTTAGVRLLCTALLPRAQMGRVCSAHFAQCRTSTAIQAIRREVGWPHQGCRRHRRLRRRPAEPSRRRAEGAALGACVAAGPLPARRGQKSGCHAHAQQRRPRGRARCPPRSTVDRCLARQQAIPSRGMSLPWLHLLSPSCAATNAALNTGPQLSSAVYSLCPPLPHSSGLGPAPAPTLRAPASFSSVCRSARLRMMRNCKIVASRQSASGTTSPVRHVWHAGLNANKPYLCTRHCGEAPHPRPRWWARLPARLPAARTPPE